MPPSAASAPHRWPNTVSCSSCGRTNPLKQNFCNGCGQPLARAAGRTVSPDPRTYAPKHLAEKILISRAALEGERKQVTILFADVKGSMEHAERLDPVLSPRRFETRPVRRFDVVSFRELKK